MRITILGKSPSWQDAGGACSGYLIQEGDTNVLLDCGNGVFAKLRQQIDYLDVDAVVISHLHADHVLDLVPFAYALSYSPRQQPVPVGGYSGTDDPVRPELVVPEGGRELLRRLSELWGRDDLIEGAFRIREYAPDDVIELGPLRARFALVPHYIPTFAVEVAPEAGGPRLVFSADCSPNDALVEFARDAELLLIEATLPRPERSGDRGHLTADEAGQHGRRAGVQRLVLTHLSDEINQADSLQAASEEFGSPVTIAAEGDVFEV